MEFWDVLTGRRSIRHFVVGKPVEIDKIYQMIDAARYAPSSGNLQTTNYLVVTKDELKQKLAKLSLNQLWIAKASAIIVICAAPQKAVSYYGEHGKPYAVQNAIFGAANMLLEAQDLGVSTCYVSAFDEYGVKSLLRIPDDVIVPGIVAVGYASEKSEMPVRHELRSYIFINRWNDRVEDFKFSVLGATSHRVEAAVKETKTLLQRANDKLNSIFQKKRNVYVEETEEKKEPIV